MTSPQESLTGTLDLREHAAVEPTAALTAAVVQYLRGDGPVDDVLVAFRAAELVVELAEDDRGGRQRMVVVRQEALSWVPVCTTTALFAQWAQLSGRGAERIHFGLITGAELLDTCLPQLPRGTGLLLDPGTDRVLALPPVARIVGPDLAVDQQQEES